MQSQNHYLEIVRPLPSGGRIRHALFDFDGTLSLIREGWQEVMGKMMVEALAEASPVEQEDDLAREAADLIAHTTGQATLSQMEALAEAVRGKGGTPQTAQEYKARFLERLLKLVRERLDALETGRLAREALMVQGAAQIVDALTKRGVVCSLASGTDHTAVVHEARLLQLLPYFGERVYGARDDAAHLTKGEVIALIKRRNQLEGAEVVVIGDGRVEIAEAKAARAIAVGVASDEKARTGVDAKKRTSLIAAGADLIIPDFSRPIELIAYLLDGRGSN